MTLSQGLRICLLSLLGALGLQGQPSLTALWARHDQLVMDPAPRVPMDDAPRAFVFKGRRGQRVQGWDMGPSDAPVVLTWKGGPGSGFDPVREAWVQPGLKAFRRLELDQPGTGGSAWVPNWQPEDMADDAATFLRMRGIKEPVIVTGWSWGSTMALLFAQRHPERVRGVVVGGVWTNTPREVQRYLDGDGARAWMPGLSDAFGAFGKGGHLATGLHDAIERGRGGKALAMAYDDAEGLQAGEGTLARKPLAPPLADVPGTPVDMDTERDGVVRFAYIESEMMARGQRHQWHLRLRFPPPLRKVTLLVLQGRYDQVCDPEIARKVCQAWPGTHKLLVPYNGGHGSFKGPTHEELTQASLALTPDQERALKRATALHFGSALHLRMAAMEMLLSQP